VKKLLSAFVGAAILLGSFSSAKAADFVDEHWTPATNPQGEGWRSLYLGDNTTLNREPSAIYAESTSKSTSGNFNSFHCADVDSFYCVQYGHIMAQAFLQPCSIVIVTNCIESFYAITASGEKISGIQPERYPLTGQYEFSARDDINLPAGGAPTIFTLPGVNHGGGNDQYMVQAWTTNYLDKEPGKKITTEQFSLGQMTVNVVPVTQVLGRYSQQIAQDSLQTYEQTGRGVAHPSLDEWRFCAMIDFGNCQKRQAFPENVQFGVKIRILKKITGWLHGRVSNPAAVIKILDSGEQTIEVTALPIKVPVVGEWFKWDQLTPDIQKYVLDGKVFGGQGIFSTKSLAIGNFQEMVGTSGEDGFAALTLWIPQIKDRASANPSTWTFYNLTQFQLGNANQCIANATDLVGFVTTNASVYAAGFPVYNSENQSLDYKVMAPHYTARGDVFKGTYDLRIRSEVARCIYGFTSAPIKASISILSEDGTMQTATETIHEDKGWLSLSASGFTYSSPTIRVKLSQESPVIATPSPSATVSPSASATPTPTIAKKSVSKKITCKKGSVKKVFRGSSPKCPAGYKKVG
jgi:hypothetical protein